jgi:hypothetical protein
MRYSRRKFNGEFRLAAVRRLEMGAFVARRLLARRIPTFRDGIDRAFPGLGKKKAGEPQAKRP